MARKVTKPKTDPFADLRDKWVNRLDDEEKAHKQFRDFAERASKAYFATAMNADNTNSDSNTGYPLFWSIVNVLHGRIFAQPPTPDVRKRNPDEPGVQPLVPSQQAFPAADAILAGLPPGAQGGNAVPAGAAQPGQPPAGMVPGGGQPAPAPVPTVDDNKISQLFERAIKYIIDTTQFSDDSNASVNDFLVAALGVAKVEMDVETQEIPVLHPDTQQALPKLDEDGNALVDDEGKPIPLTQEVITDQKLRLRHVAWNQFRWEPKQHWGDVNWVAFRHGMTKVDIEERWGVVITSAQSNSTTFKAGGGSGLESDKPQSDKYENLIDVFECWDRLEKEVIWVCPKYEDALEVTPDPLQLADFYPCPKPMMSNIRGDDLVPQPDYAKCESMFQAANVIYGRIDSLTRQVKDIGFYDAAFPKLVELTTADDGSLIPISNLLKQLNDINPGNGQLGYDAIVFKQDNKTKVETIQLLQQELDDIESKIDKSYGIADIQRAETNPDETATAQNIKAEWADIRVGQRIAQVARFFRDVFRIMADIVATFPPDILEKMTGIQLNPAELAVVQSDVGRCYAVDVESDSTVVQDQSAVMAERTQMLQAVTGYLKEIGPMMQQNQIPGDLGKELLLFAVNTYKSGRQIEDAINNLPGTMQQLTQQQQTIQQLQQQMQNLVKQNQAQAKALGAINQAKDQQTQTETALKVQAAPVENAKKAAEVGKTQAETEHTQVLSAAEAEGAAKAAIDNTKSRVLPFAPHVPPNRGPV